MNSGATIILPLLALFKHYYITITLEYSLFYGLNGIYRLLTR